MAGLPKILQPRHPAQFVALAFAAAIAVATALLMIPVASEPGVQTGFHTALFTATSALCVIGLSTVDTPNHWSAFGEVVILVSMQIGGLGIMTIASLLGLVVSRRLGLRTRLTAQAETRSLDLGDVRRLLKNVAITMLAIESVLALMLALRLHFAYDTPWGYAFFSGLFHSVSAANNAGFSLYSDSLMGFVTDPFICIPIAAVIILSSLGFPVLFELVRELHRPSLWSMLTKITVFGTAVLVLGGTFMFAAFEWTNPATLGPLDVPGKLLASFFQGVTPRSAGFNSLDFAQLHETTWLGTDVLMFIGGGSAGTAGGIKVTTFMVLFFAIVAEARGDADADAFGRRMPVTTLRLAISVALLGIAVVVLGTMAMLALTGLDLDKVLFEVTSAFGTAGLSTGITPTLEPSAQYLLVVLMFIGRIGTITLASALALRSRQRLYRLPEEHLIVG